MPVDNRHKYYDKWRNRWQITRDGLAGEDEIKDKKETYLPRLGGQEQDAYEAYLKRAKYYNVSGRILEVAKGQLFRKDPVFPEDYERSEYLEDITLSGESFDYVSRDLAEEIMTVNRVGVLVDWSEEQNRPYLTVYKAENIINWQVKIIDGIVKTSLVMLEGTIQEVDPEDSYKQKDVKIWHELYLEEGIYKSRKWRKETNGTKFVIVEDSEVIPEFNNSFMNFIPFYMITTKGISIDLIKAPMSNIVSLNLGHYINSADYENMLHWTGARTIIAKGWEENKVFPVGACAVFPVDGDCTFLEASSDSALEEGMKRKEEQMSVLGSAMITGKGRYVASAKTAEVTSQGEYATLADIANALSDSMTKILRVMEQWQNNEESDITITYNTDYDLTEQNVQDIVALSGLLSSNSISWETYFYNLKEREYYPPDWTIKDEKEAISKTVDQQMEIRDKKMPEIYNMPEEEKEKNVEFVKDENGGLKGAKIKG